MKKQELKNILIEILKSVQNSKILLASTNGRKIAEGMSEYEVDENEKLSEKDLEEIKILEKLHDDLNYLEDENNFEKNILNFDILFQIEVWGGNGVYFETRLKNLNTLDCYDITYKQFFGDGKFYFVCANKVDENKEKHDPLYLNNLLSRIDYKLDLFLPEVIIENVNGKLIHSESESFSKMGFNNHCHITKNEADKIKEFLNSKLKDFNQTQKKSELNIGEQFVFNYVLKYDAPIYNIFNKEANMEFIFTVKGLKNYEYVSYEVKQV